MRLLAVVLAVVCLIGIGVSWVAGSAWQSRTHLLAAAELARDLSDQLENRQPAQARQTLAALQERTRAARARTDGPGWRGARRVPVLGGSLAAIAEVATALDDLAHDGLPALVDVAGEVDPAQLAPRDGRIDLAPLQRAAPRINAASREVIDVRDRIAAIPAGDLLPPVRSAVTHLRRELDRAAATIDAAARTATLAPAMLGADGPRTYLVLFQNNAELRATGGVPGAFAVVEADRGSLRIVHQGTAASDLGSFERPVLPLDPAMRELYTDRLGIYPANVNLTPHFPTAAALAREMYRLRSGRTVDGVVATDPVALSYLLHVAGPVAAGEGPPLTAENTVQALLSDVYARYDSNVEQDEYFAEVAAAAFEAILDGTDVPAALPELARAAGERRLLVWSANPVEQRLITGTVLAGELPSDDGARPVVGVFLNDGSGAKLGFYLTQSAQLTSTACRPDGRQELRLRVTLRSTAPPAGLPPSVLGLELAGDPHTVRTNVSIFSPAGGALVDARLDGGPVLLGTGTERGRVVGILTVDLPPGTDRTVEVTLLTGTLPREGPIAAELWLTPTAAPWLKNVVSTMVCPSSG